MAREFDMNNGLIRMYTFDGQSTAIRHSEAITEEMKPSFFWVHLDANAIEVRDFFEHEPFKLDSLMVDALLTDETRPRFVPHSDGVLLIVRSVNRSVDALIEDMVSLRFWVDAGRILSVQRRNSSVIEYMDDQLSSGKKFKGPGDFVVHMLWNLFEDMGEAIADLSADLDALEEAILEKPLSLDHHDISILRKKTIHLRRYIEPHRTAIQNFKNSDVPWLNKQQKRHLQECLDVVTKHVEHLDSIRERSQVASDEIANAFARKMNQNVYFLSLIAAIFLPLGFLTGLFGINVGGIPGAGSEYAFAIFCGGLLVVIALQIFLFSRMKFFK